MADPSVQELESTRKALVDRFTAEIKGVVEELERHRKEVQIEEAERDRLLRESAPVLRPTDAAKLAGVSLSRVEQIIGKESA